MGKASAVIFDVDGVIVQTIDYHYRSWAILLKRYFGFDFKKTDNEHLRGLRRSDSLNLVLNLVGTQANESKREELLTEKNDIYLRLIRDINEADLVPGVKDFLMTLQSHHMPCALASSSKNAKMTIEMLSLAEYFQVMVDGNDTTRGKPDPEVYLLAADLLGHDPHDCLVFEDALSGYQAALSANMSVIGIGPSLKDVASIHFNDFQDLTFDSMFQKSP